jgi:mRNA interferase RelE/StbE
VLYKIDLSPKALDFYNKLHFYDHSDFLRIDAALNSLKINPFKGKLLKLSLKGNYSLRVGVYRIVYSINRQTILVYILKIGHRRDVYN